MAWKIRHQGSPQARSTTLAEIVDGLRDGLWEPTDEVQGPGETGWTALGDHPQLAEVAEEATLPPPPPPEEERVDMNALIDVCLVLLIFFMMTATLAVAVQKTVPLPTLAEESQVKALRTIRLDQVRKQMIRINAEMDKGRPLVRVQGQKVDVVKDDGSIDGAKLASELQKYTHDNPPRDEVLLDARGVNWGTVVAVQDAARSAGVHMIHYPVEKK
jgi:biopolymer transport protein ExbD